MVIIYLLVTLTISYAYPLLKVEPDDASIEDSKEFTNLGNDIFGENSRVTKLNSNCNKTIDYNEIIRTIQQINSLRDKTLEMLENSIVEKKEATKTTPSSTESSTIIMQSTFNDNNLIRTTNYDFSTETSTLELENQTINSTNINDENDDNSTTSRQIRDDKKLNELNETMFETQEEEDAGLLGAILSGFLGSLSKPDGSVDVDAVIRTIAMLSAPQADGSYDFQGLTDTLNAFFGGDDDEDGGGSNVGAFAGGLTAALIKGITRPGAKGVGSFLGSLLKEILPAASAPAEPAPEGSSKPQVDAGGFLGGLLHTLFGEDMDKGMSSFQTVKNNILRFSFSAISSILGTSSAGASGGGNSKPNQKLVLKYPK